MPGFRYEVKHDLELATEVASMRPNKPADWDAVVQKLNGKLST